ncbi:rhodanese-like domain-containing protein [Flagellimonas aquimarina]|uniref:Rhodanese-like domain-containing protein n=1 Tax=Flagellimonas aquimarina TaxID=2201895 RepID=A0A316L0H8_9FLAO|nr:rhodanese-like domain-containing protein [Allomuricauda koreensis]PWL39614.1 rhodanese-like domain-containing protein [Allomuricauda koreensis]
MKSVLKISLFSFCFLLLASCKTKEEGTIVKIDKKTVKTDVVGNDVQFIDVRTPEEYKDGRIDDAINFNFKDSTAFLSQIATLNKEEPVYLYCRRGTRSNNAAILLKTKGFKKIFDYSGGYDDWSATE